MLVYLDTAVIIYAVEGAPDFRARALDRLSILGHSGEQPAISHLTCLECLIKPVRLNDRSLQDDFDRFLTSPGIARIPMTKEVFERATFYRAWSRYQSADALHLATAVVAGCGLFLTNDHRLSKFSDLPVEILP